MYPTHYGGQRQVFESSRIQETEIRRAEISIDTHIRIQATRTQRESDSRLVYCHVGSLGVYDRLGRSGKAVTTNRGHKARKSLPVTIYAGCVYREGPVRVFCPTCLEALLNSPSHIFSVAGADSAIAQPDV